MVFGRATDQTQSGCRLVPHGIRMKDRSQTGNQQYSLLAFWVFWMLSLGVSYESVTRPTTKKSNKVLGLELLERDLERGKPLFRRKRGKVRNLDGSGHKGLADSLDSALESSFSQMLMSNRALTFRMNTMHVQSQALPAGSSDLSISLVRAFSRLGA